jgi:hypothetical protein
MACAGWSWPVPSCGASRGRECGRLSRCIRAARGDRGDACRELACQVFRLAENTFDNFASFMQT